MRNYGIIWILFIAFVGCAPATVQGLRESHADRYEFIADENYQSVYRKVLYQARKCYQTGLITAQMVVQGDLFHDLKSGNVSVALHGGLGVDTYLTVDVYGLDEKTSRVVVYYALATWRSAARAVKEWVQEDSTQCRPIQN